MSHFQLILSGFLGGLSPTLAMAAGYAATGGTPPIAAGVSAVLFGLLGAIVAHQMENNDRKSAFVSGIAAPGIISSIVAGVADGRNSNADRQDLAADWTWMGAYAQEHEAGGEIGDGFLGLRTLTINTEILGGVPSRPSLEILGVSPIGTETSAIAILPIVPGTTTISIPDHLREIVIEGQTVPIGDTDMISVEISTSPTFWGDVAWGFGGNRHFEIDGLTATQTIESGQ